MPYANPQDKKAHDRRYYIANKDAIKAKVAAWTKENHASYKSRLREYYKTRGRDKAYQAQYGITLADYERMFEEQKGLCAICGTDKPSPKRKNFAVDHCHSSGVVRGLLCIACNSNVGWFERNADKVDLYLKRER